MIVSAIVATTQNLVIGKDNKMLWHLPADLRYFKRTTLHHHLIMGRKCYESIGRPLPKRTNIIVTRDLNYEAEGCVVLHSIAAALDYACTHGETEAFITGGGQIYEQSLHLCDKLYLTEVETELEGDVFFPKIDTAAWTIISEECHLKDEKNPYNYSFKVLQATERGVI